jgi:peptide/nickel transport system substrate-binding protein
MQTRILRLRWRRRLKKSQRQVEDLSSQAEEQIDRHLFKRFDRLIPVRRFVIIWVGLVVLLIVGIVIQNFALGGYFQVAETIPGGIYNEGLQGEFTNANPIYATSDADTTVSSLIFAGLFKTGASGQLVGDLASSYSLDSRGTTYTIHLKPDLKWQDGQPLTSKDVVFTYQTIQNPNADSPLFSNWEGINVSAPNPTTVIIKLPDILASFPYSLTTGILPMHLLDNIPPADLRSADFNTIHPVGAGPFALQALQVINGSDPQNEQVQIALKPFSDYEGGTPKLDKFVVQIYANQNQLVSAFKSKQLTAMEAAIPPGKKVEDKPGVIDHNFILRAANMVFFKTSSGVLADQSVRQAIVEATNTPKIINSLGYKTTPVNEPLLIGQLAYNPIYAQNAFNPTAANSLLSSDGWTKYVQGIRYKNNQPLSFTLTAENTPENQLVTKQLQTDWKQVGLNLNVQLLQPTDFQSSVSYHDYDAILAPITIGIDPDVFVYWDSSQADLRSTNRLNLSEWDNPTVDTALESGRTRLNPAERIIKYQPFLQAWQQQSPALGLYQPRLLYLTNGTVGGLNTEQLSSPTDRFNNVQNWEIRQAKVTI